ncbi:lipopolysaccharide assembly protein LapA domain-containing protein [Paracoccus pacificus]|uniref:lipopolysaccharide assembly protein LapA domain-containing protein n=1 Tax=Paracoccus pacificus TaxID=1463598 RepID=UPI0036D424E5
MRAIRFLFVILLAIVLIGLALANRGMVTVKVFPANLGSYLGLDWQVTMPLFLLILLAMLIGMVLGLVWEWLREAQLRSESARRARELASLEREMGRLRETRTVAPQDDVLAIVDAPANPPAISR